MQLDTQKFGFYAKVSINFDRLDEEGKKNEKKKKQNE